MIMHLDGDAFFVSCEVSKNPKLLNKPVVVGEDKGIATALSYEAKKLGLIRGMPIFKIRKFFPDVIVLPSDFPLYYCFSKRAMSIVRKYIDRVEEYSIDECFAQFPKDEKNFEKIARKIKDEIFNSLRITFSFGISNTKVLSKIASKRNKPNGFTILYPNKVNEYLSTVPIGGIWGIGPETSHKMQSYGIMNALQFSQMKLDKVKEIFNMPQIEIWHELNGISVFPVLKKGEIEHRKSIQDTRSFRPANSNIDFLIREISMHTENVCKVSRDEGLMGNHISYFIKTKSGEYKRDDFKLNNYTNIPNNIIQNIIKRFHLIYDSEYIYKASGVTFSGLIKKDFDQNDLFSEYKKEKNKIEVYKTVDNIIHEYGDKSIMLASSMKKDHDNFFFNKDEFPLPFLGEVT